mmetsp:Transcript_138134/g.240261  ORF Transcript_138134/g.240261 Transcript_138134/m.240261 type:complete len:200 (+) Transcript_138134:87-686(+)
MRQMVLILLTAIFAVASAKVHQHGLRRTNLPKDSSNPLQDVADDAHEVAKNIEKTMKEAHKKLLQPIGGTEEESHPAEVKASPAASPAASPGTSPAGPVPAPAPVPAIAVAPAPAPVPIRLRDPKNVLKSMKVGRGLPESGYNEFDSHKLVDHEDGETATKDFGEEWPQTDETHNESLERICKEQPKGKWCKMFLRSRK